MVVKAQSQLAFGKADLSNCEREQVHLAGSIQPFGAMLVIREPDLTIVQASANAAAFLGVDGGLVGCSLGAMPGNLLARVRPHLEDVSSEVPVPIRCRIGVTARELDGLLHRAKGGGIVIELEEAGPPVDLSRHAQRALTSIMGCASLQRLCDEAAKLFRQLTGYDRVMVYRFDAEGHGQVFSERKRAHLEPFLGNWYPASDIPQMARRLYEKNRVRILVDVAAVSSPLVPRLAPSSGEDLDMSLCFLRSMSPLHIQYLKNMGVAATLVVSLMVGGKLWGLIACHHYAPRFVHFEVRAVCELLAEAFATRVAALDAFAQVQAEMAVRRLEQHMVETIAREGDWRVALFDRSNVLITLLRAQGAALILEGEVQTIGDVPGTQAIRLARGWLQGRPDDPVMATTSLHRDLPDLVMQMPGVGGLLAVPISDTRADYLIWFRPERIEAVTWGGNPRKPFLVGNDPLELSPRRSFAQWHELVEGTCEAWSPAEHATARMLGEMVADVVLQFRTVRMLIVQDQLNQVGAQLHGAEQAVAIFDAQGQSVMNNQAFLALLAGRVPPRTTDGMAALFEIPAVVTQNIRDLVRHRRPWRGEALFQRADGDPIPLLVRADPVLSAPGRVLGFVFLFMDITPRRSAEAARAQFLEGIGAPHQFAAARVAAASAPIFSDLMAIVVENAQLAALEITDGLGPGELPGMLTAIQASVDRTAAVLERLVWHTTRLADNDE